MTTAQRIKHLLGQHGDSIRDASAKSGVPRATLARLLQGSDANLAKWLPMIAAAYQVEPSSLLEGGDPKVDFEWHIRRASPRERLDMAMMTVQERVRLTIEVLAKIHPRRCTDIPLDRGSALRPEDVLATVARWDFNPPDLVTAKSMAQSLSLRFGISMSWFCFGTFDDEPGTLRVAMTLPKASLPAQKGKAGYASTLKELREIAAVRLGGVI